MKFSKSFSMFKSVKGEPNAFRYKSRFYDAEKEEKAKRRKSVELDVEREKEDGKRFEFARQRSNENMRKSYKQQVFNSNLVIIVVLIVLCFISYAVIKYLDTIHV